MFYIKKEELGCSLVHLTPLARGEGMRIIDRLNSLRENPFK